jgi:hypothetical protein
MKWRVMVELGGIQGTVQMYEVSAGGSTTVNYSAETLGLSVAEGKMTLPGLQRHSIQAQAEEHCRSRRRCDSCGAQRPLKDFRCRRRATLFGVVEVRSPRFGPRRCGVASRRTITPVAEIMPDRCTPEYERRLAKMGSLLPYSRARALLDEFFPLGDAPEVETIRQRTLQVGARLEKTAVRPPSPAASAEARSIALAIDGGQVKAVCGYQGRSFEAFAAQVSNGDGKQVVFSSMPGGADRQAQQLPAYRCAVRRGNRLGPDRHARPRHVPGGAVDSGGTGDAVDVAAESRYLQPADVDLRSICTRAYLGRSHAHQLDGGRQSFQSCAVS